MVYLKMKVRCTVCDKMIELSNESGEFNGEVAKFECEHFKGSIMLETKVGWLFGTNAEVKYDLHMKCLRCNEENVVSISGSGLTNKSDYKAAQFCQLNHFLKIEYEQDSLVSGAVDKISSVKDSSIVSGAMYKLSSVKDSAFVTGAMDKLSSVKDSVYNMIWK